MPARLVEAHGFGCHRHHMTLDAGSGTPFHRRQHGRVKPDLPDNI
jgi:hypothetical protein